MLKNQQKNKDHSLMMTIALIAFGVFLMQTLFSCASTPTVTDISVKPIYEYTLSGNLDGVDFHGVALGSNSKSHLITLNSKSDINYFSIQSCHRFNKFQDIDKQTVFGKWLATSRSYQFTYNESLGIEDAGNCPVEFCAYSKTVGSAPVSCAMADFRHDSYSLPGLNTCNGAQGPSTGTSICSTQKGLKERVEFSSEVQVAPPIADVQGNLSLVKNQCAGTLDASGKVFSYVIPAANCYVIFLEKAKPHRRAKLEVFPWDLPQYSGGL